MNKADLAALNRGRERGQVGRQVAQQGGLSFRETV